MKKDLLAKDIVRYVGGKENVKALHHCQTRLRFNLVDESKAQTTKIEKLDGVIQVLNKGGMYQIVIGTEVESVYDEVMKVLGDMNMSEVTETKEKKKAFDVVSDFVSGIFSPIVPALAGAGMVKALLALLSAFSLVDKTSQTYVLINMFGDATFAFMPVLLAFTTAKKLKCNPILAAVTAGIMCHSTWTGLVSAGEAVKLFGVIPFYLVKYTNSVIPIVIVMFVQAPLEKWLNKVIPGPIRLVFAPMLEFIIMGTLALSILGPLGDYVGTVFTSIFTWLSTTAAWLELGLLGGTYSILVIFGLHHGLAPIGTMQMAQMGYDGVFGPAVVCANVGQGTASLVTGLLSKDSRSKQIGISAGITGLMGTTEPALYGINVPKKYPLIAGAIGSLCGSLYAGITKTHRFATGSSGLPAVVMYIGEDTMTYFYNIIIALVITIVVAAILTVIFYKHFENKTTDLEVIKENTITKDEEVYAPVEGNVKSLKESSDEAFASEGMGKGCVIEPTSNVVVAPFDGKVVSLFPTKHAIGLISNDGLECLIHIGIDTVEMNGDGFTAFVEQGDSVKKGQKLIEFDISKISKAGHSTETMVIITNTNDYKGIDLVQTGTVKTGSVVLKVSA